MELCTKRGPVGPDQNSDICPWVGLRGWSRAFQQDGTALDQGHCEASEQLEHLTELGSTAAGVASVCKGYGLRRADGDHGAETPSIVPPIVLFPSFTNVWFDSWYLTATLNCASANSRS